MCEVLLFWTQLSHCMDIMLVHTVLHPGFRLQEQINVFLYICVSFQFWHNDSNIANVAEQIRVWKKLDWNFWMYFCQNLTGTIVLREFLELLTHVIAVTSLFEIPLYESNVSFLRGHCKWKLRSRFVGRHLQNELRVAPCDIKVSTVDLIKDEQS